MKTNKLMTALVCIVVIVGLLSVVPAARQINQLIQHYQTYIRVADGGDILFVEGEYYLYRDRYHLVLHSPSGSEMMSGDMSGMIVVSHSVLSNFAARASDWPRLKRCRLARTCSVTGARVASMATLFLIPF